MGKLAVSMGRVKGSLSKVPRGPKTPPGEGMNLPRQKKEAKQ